jgi:hypothetical protein
MGNKPRRLSLGFAHACLLCMLAAAPAAGFAGPGLPVAWQPARPRSPHARAGRMVAMADDPARASSPAAGSSVGDFSQPLMAAVSGDGYDAVMALVIGFGLHACEPEA